METNVRYTIVGMFVVVLFGLLIFSVIWLSTGLSDETYSIYKVYMKETVSGLTVDASVEFNGVNVGTVKSIQISRKNPKLVELLLRVRSSTPITEGTRATMNMRGLTGVTFIALQDKGTDPEPLVAKPGEAYPVIQTTPSLLTRFDLALTELNSSIHQVSVSVKQLLSDENIKELHAILVNVRALTDQLQPFISTGLTTMDSINHQTLPAFNQSISLLDTIMNNLVEITAELKQNPAVLIRGKEPRALGPGER